MGSNLWTLGIYITKVFIIVWGLTEHRDYLVLMIIKQYLLSTKPLTTEK